MSTKPGTMIVSRASITCAPAALSSGAMAAIFLPSISTSPLDEVADLGIQADDGAATQQDAMLRIDGRLPLEMLHRSRVGGLGRQRTTGRNTRSDGGAYLQRIAARHATITLHDDLLCCHSTSQQV